MKLLYPASNQIPRLNTSAKALKIARHSRCTQCSSCSGLRPPPGTTVSLDQTENESSFGGLAQYGSDDDDGSSNYIESCACGHDVKTHGADLDTIDEQEFVRKARVAVRADEYLEDDGKLLDFEYTNETINGLRNQMVLFDSGGRSPPLDDLDRQILSPGSSSLSDVPHQPRLKRRRTSTSSLSNNSSDSDEEDKPLAERFPAASASSSTANTANQSPTTSRTDRSSRLGPGHGARRGGKKTAGMSMKAKSSTAPAHLPPPTEEEQEAMNDQTNGIMHDGFDGNAKVKVEDVMDESQLNRLAGGVTVDSGGAGPHAPPPKQEKVAQIELRKGVIQIIPVENDGEPRSLVILTNLKTLFQKQLPKMPREYIARLVFDYNSRCLGIIKRGYKVVGGICFRPFPHRGFAEIVFFATTSIDQVKGYGAMLMNHFKTHIQETYPGMNHFLTYADNYAVGYFKKQGFSKDITLPRSVWAGYIKDYEGGTIMQCTMVRKVDYLRTKEIVAQQREAIMSKIREMSKSHIVHSGLNIFKEGWREGLVVDPKDVPGLRESGWTPSMVTSAPRPSNNRSEHNRMRRLLADLQNHPLGWAFLVPVNVEDVTDYLDVIKNPMDFSTMEHKLDTNQYPNIDAFAADAFLVFENCRTYNPEGTIYYKNAGKLEKFVRDWLADRVKKDEG